MLKEFRDFVMRGNLVELAVAVIIATALTTVVKSLIDNLIMPVVAAIGGEPDFRDLTFTVNDAQFRYGAFITDVVAFVILAAVIFFFIIKPFTTMMERLHGPKAEEEPQPTPETLLAEIRDLIEAQNSMMRK